MVEDRMGDSYGAVMAGLPCRPRTPTRRGSLARTAAAACMMTVLATACFDLQMDLVVHDDGSGSLNVTVRIDAAMVERAAAMMERAAPGEGGSAEDFCQQFVEEAGVVETADLDPDVLDSSIEAVVENGDCVVTATSAWGAGDSETVLDSLAEDDGPRIRRLDEGGWRFDWGLDSVEEEFASDDLAAIATMVLDLPTLTVAVTLPGEPVEHNAQSVHQSTYTWVLDTADPSGYPETLYAETAAGGGGLGPAAIGGIVAGIVLALAALVTLRNHQQAKAADSEDAEPTGNDVPEAAEEAADEASDSDVDTDEASDGDTPGPDDGDDHFAQRSTET